MELTVSSMAALNYLGQNNQNEEKHDLFHYAMPLVSILFDANGIITGTIEFLRPRQSK